MENNIEIKFEKIEVTEENMKKLLNKKFYIYLTSAYI